jgi:acyl-ACP thioesterase
VDEPVVMVDPPGRGRLRTEQRRVRSGDADADRVLRLDGVARYAQDIAFDDVHDAAAGGDEGLWVLRRTVIVVHRLPVFHDPVQVRTWCSGIGARWCTKRTTVSSAGGARVEVEGFWVTVDAGTGRPAPLSPRMVAIFAPSAAPEPLRWRRLLPARPGGTSGAVRRPVPLRSTDVDWMGHVNNATCWSVVEQVLPGLRATPVEAVLEHAAPIAADDQLEVLVEPAAGATLVWFLVGDTVRAVARVRPVGREVPPLPSGSTTE